MQLSPDLFNGAINNAAQMVNWMASADCPCRDDLSGAAKLGCLSCSGKGVIWSPAVSGACIPAGMRIQRQWSQMAQFESGDTVITVGSDSPIYNAGENDRLLMVQSTEAFKTVLQYTGSETTGYPITQITRVFWLDPSTMEQVQAGIPGFSDTGQIDWTTVVGGPAPPSGVKYSIGGRRIPEYFVFGDMMGDRAHFYGAALPRRVVLRKFDLFGK